MAATVRDRTALIEVNVDIGTGGTSLLAARLGFWSAIVFALMTVVFDIGAAFGAAGTPVGAWPAAAAFAIAPAFLILIVALHLQSETRLQAWSLIALSFAIVYAAIVALNYGLQVSVVRRFPAAYSLLTLELQPQSAFWALEAVGYTFMSAAALLLAPLLRSSASGRVVGWIFVANAVGDVLGAAAYLATGDPAHPFAILSLAIWGVGFPIAGVLLAFDFRRRLPG